jgi:hypothetical protein
MKKLILAALLAATSFVPAAFAQSANSTVTFSNFHYTLTDLTPDDGIAPSAAFTFLNYAYVLGSNPGSNDQTFSKDDVATQSAAVSAPGYSISASTTAGTGLQHLNGASATASGSAIISGDETPYSDGKQISAYSASTILYSGDFTLAPGSQITFYADVHAFASSDTGTTNDESFARAIGWFSGSAGNDYFSTSVQANATHNNDFGLKTDEMTQALQVTFSNDGFKPLTGYFNIRGDIGGSAVNMLPVPEPSTYAMFLAGLGLIGFAKRRRK